MASTSTGQNKSKGCRGGDATNGVELANSPTHGSYILNILIGPLKWKY